MCAASLCPILTRLPTAVLSAQYTSQVSQSQLFLSLLSSRASLEIPPRGVSSYDQCDFFDENFDRPYCKIEYWTHQAVRRAIQPSDSVLEIGSRYGTTTCEVAVRQNNSANLVAVEPDHTVWSAAEVITSISLPTQCLNVPQYHS